MSGHTIEQDHRNRTVDITLTGVTVLAENYSDEDGQDAITVGMTADAYRSFAASVAASLPSERQASSLGMLSRAFAEARKPLLDMHGDQMSAYRVIDLTRVLERAATDAVYAENAVGGEARGVVLNAAKELGVVLRDVGPCGSIWDEANMRRVVAGAKAVVDERNKLRDEAERFSKTWLAPLVVHAPTEHTWSTEERAHADLVDELRATIVRQANEITALKEATA